FFVRVSLVLYGLNIAFDLFYVGVLQIGPRGIPLGLLSGLVVTCALAYRRNVAELRLVFERPLGTFTLKTLAASGMAAAVVAVLHVRMQGADTGFPNFLYLCELCSAGSLVFIGSLAALRAIQPSQLSGLWRAAEDL